MPYRPEAELKRPDLKGEFLCGHCGKTFCHAASLNRHRLNFHGDDQECMLCNTKIPTHETVRRHMMSQHSISRVFTCGCCNWTFPDKKELHSHNNSMLRTGQPGEAKAIAISSRTPGSLSQSELRNDELHLPSTVPSYHKSSSTPKKSFDAAENLIQFAYANNMGKITGAAAAGSSTQWLTSFIQNNPTIIPLLMQQFNQNSLNMESKPSTSLIDESIINNNNNNNNNKEEDDKFKSMLHVKTEGTEIGVNSTEEITDNSPCSSSISKESSPSSSSNTHRVVPQKRKSVDAIASLLLNKKQCLL